MKCPYCNENELEKGELFCSACQEKIIKTITEIEEEEKNKSNEDIPSNKKQK